MAGGLNYCYQLDLVWLLIAEIILTIGYTLVCLYCTQDTQLNIAKWLTFIFAIVMVIVTVGLITQVSRIQATFDKLDHAAMIQLLIVISYLNKRKQLFQQLLNPE